MEDSKRSERVGRSASSPDIMTIEYFHHSGTLSILTVPHHRGSQLCKKLLQNLTHFRDEGGLELEQTADDFFYFFAAQRIDVEF